MTRIEGEDGAIRNYAYDPLDRKVFSARRNGKFAEYATLALYDGRRNVFEQDTNANMHGSRTWMQSGDADLMKGDLLHRTTSTGRNEFISSEYTPEQISSLSIHTDRLGSAIFAGGSKGKAMVQYGYSDFGEVYIKDKNYRGKFLPGTAKVPEELINREIVNRLYTGGTHDQLSGLIHLEARHYSPEKAKFIQPDPYNLAELSLPPAVRHILVRQANLSIDQLLKSPSMQLGSTYVSGNPYRYTDPLGLADFFVGAEGDAFGIVGGEGSFGIVIDTDTPEDSGVFRSGGVGFGGSVGIGFGAGFNTEDIEGGATNFDANIKNISVTYTKNDEKGWGAAVTVGLGIGFSASHTDTKTYTVRDAWNGVKSAISSFFGGKKSCP